MIASLIFTACATWMLCVALRPPNYERDRQMSNEFDAIVARDRRVRRQIREACDRAKTQNALAEAANIDWLSKRMARIEGIDEGEARERVRKSYAVAKSKIAAAMHDPHRVAVTRVSRIGLPRVGAERRN